MAPNSLKAYHISAARVTEDKDIILIKLLKGAINFIEFAKKGILQNSPDVKGRYISKTMAIIIELDTALDRDIKNEIVKNLSSLYQFILNSLSNANIKNNIAELNNTQKILIDLKDGFISATDKNKTDMYNVQTYAEHKPARRLSVAL